VTIWPRAIAQGWHPIAYLSEIPARAPWACRLMGRALVAFRNRVGGVSVFADRCPHRGAPLSRGRIEAGALVCPYHGWRFAPEGACLEAPGASDCPPAHAEVMPVRIEAGLVWTSLAEAPPAFPALPEAMSDPALDRFWWRLPASEADLLDALENHLDPAHPHHVHPWLVRHPRRRAPTSVDVRMGPWGGEAVYVEERRNAALLSQAMEGKRARSIGRLWPPTIGEVRLEAAGGAMLSIAVVFSPREDGWTRPYAHFASTRGRLPAWVKQGALKAFHRPVLAQDRRMLAWQRRAKGDLRFANGPLDVLSRAIWRHANGEPVEESATRRELQL